MDNDKLDELERRVEQWSEDTDGRSYIITCDELRALITAARRPETAVETGWLIEDWCSRTNTLKAQWFTLDGENCESGGWTRDSVRALRFGRKQDAQTYIDHLGWTDALPTEHRWG